MRGKVSSRYLPLRARLGVEVAFECVQGFRPHRLVLCDPLVEFLEPPWVQLVDPPLRVHFDVHEPRVAEHLEVARHRGLRESREPRRDIARVPAASREEVEDRPTRRVRDRKEDIHCPDRPHPNFFSRSAKKALESRVKSASLSLTSSPALSFTTDFSGGSLIPRTGGVRVFLHPEHGIIPSTGSGQAATA